ncbi:hypothetical protein HanHA300_Chr16g0624691 [Helianthus annuus]|nr:hypothetical protein HanHA300_Chr16g0624691 [Helianthus annuus]
MPTLGKKTLRKHNVYGLTPSVASANSILLYAKQHNDVNLMVDVIKLLKANDVPVQPGTADIIFRYALGAGLQEDIPAMIDNLSGLGVKTNIKMDDLTKIPF